jgi:hypothetical protein
MLKNYIKSAWRSLWKNKSTTAINIVGLSVGMTAAILILLWVRNELSFDGYQPDADKIFRLTESKNNNQWMGRHTFASGRRCKKQFLKLIKWRE